MTPPVPPERDIGPFYKLIGVVLSLGALALFLIKTNQGRDLSWVDLGMFGVVVLFVLCLWRPDKFDNIIKTIADRLPFINYRKPDV